MHLTQRPAHSRLHPCAALLLACALSACSHLDKVSHADMFGSSSGTAQAETAPLALQGQLSIKLHAWSDQPAKGVSLGFFFTGQAERGLLDLLTPMGTLVSQVGWDAQHAWIATQDGRREFPDIQSLSEASLGEPLPLRSLMHWAQGQPDPTLPHNVGNEPGTFIQEGWLIDTRNQAQRRIEAKRDASTQHRPIHIKVHLDQ